MASALVFDEEVHHADRLVAARFDRQDFEDVFVGRLEIGDRHGHLGDVGLQEQVEAALGLGLAVEDDLVAGDFDDLMRIAAADTTDYDQTRKTLSRLPGVARIRSSLTLRTILLRTTFKMSCLPPRSRCW